MDIISQIEGLVCYRIMTIKLKVESGKWKGESKDKPRSHSRLLISPASILPISIVFSDRALYVSSVI